VRVEGAQVVDAEFVFLGERSTHPTCVSQAVHMAFHDTSGSDVVNSNRSTVGLMITGTVIDKILPGGPAQGSHVTKGTLLVLLKICQ
jgi:hypothetical protein